MLKKYDPCAPAGEAVTNSPLALVLLSKVTQLKYARSARIEAVRGITRALVDAAGTHRPEDRVAIGILGRRQHQLRRVPPRLEGRQHVAPMTAAVQREADPALVASLALVVHACEQVGGIGRVIGNPFLRLQAVSAVLVDA